VRLCALRQASSLGVALAMACSRQVVLDFIEGYFDQNPISQLALIQLRNGTAEKITELSGNSRHHKSKLDEQLTNQKELGQGMPSLRAGLELASAQLEMQASYGVREVLILYGSLSTSDRGDIFKTVENLIEKKVKVSVVGFGAELYVAKAICEKTGGQYSVATEANKMRGKVLEMTTPPPVYETPGIVFFFFKDVCVRARACVRACVRVCVFFFVYVVCVYIYIPICTFPHTHSLTHSLTRAHAHIHTHTHPWIRGTRETGSRHVGGISGQNRYTR